MLSKRESKTLLNSLMALAENGEQLSPVMRQIVKAACTASNSYNKPAVLKLSDHLDCEPDVTLDSQGVEEIVNFAGRFGISREALTKSVILYNRSDGSGMGFDCDGLADKAYNEPTLGRTNL